MGDERHRVSAAIADVLVDRPIFQQHHVLGFGVIGIVSCQGKGRNTKCFCHRRMRVTGGAVMQGKRSERWGERNNRTCSRGTIPRH